MTRTFWVNKSGLTDSDRGPFWRYLPFGDIIFRMIVRSWLRQGLIVKVYSNAGYRLYEYVRDQ